MIDDFFRCKPLSQRIEDNRDVDAGPRIQGFPVQTFGPQSPARVVLHVSWVYLH